MKKLEMIYSAHHKDVFKFVHTRIQNADLAQEIVQDTFVRACENEQIVNKLDDQKLKNWLLKVANNLCIDYWRKSQKRKGNVKFEKIYPSEDFLTSDHVEDILNSRELENYLCLKLGQLKWEHQQAIELFDIQQLSYKECSNLLNITEVAFASLLKRARKALKNEILKEFNPNILKLTLSDIELKKLVYWFDLLDFPSNIVEQITVKSRNFFNGFNENFNSFRESTYPDGLDDTLLSAVELDKNMVAADFGCGTGNLALKLSRKAGRVIAIDHSIEMINMLKESIDSKSISNIDPVLIDMNSDLAAYYQSIHAVYCCMTLHHIFNPKSVLEEIAKTLVPGGHLIIAELAFTSDSWEFKEAHDFWSGFKKTQMQRWLEAAGLKVIQMEENSSMSFAFFDKKNPDKRIEVSLLFAHAVKKD